MTTKVLYQGQVYDPSGYAVAGRGYIRSMYDYIKANNLDMELRVVAVSADQHKSLTEEETKFLDSLGFDSAEAMDEWIEDEDYHYIFHHPPVYAWKLPITKKLAARSLTTTCFTVWETDEIPPVWNDIFESFDVDKVVVPCKWNRDSFVQSLQKFDRPRPVEMVPHLINDNFIESDNAVTEIEGFPMNKDAFKVLTVGQWTDRKALKAVVKAFLMEFKDNTDCELIVKTYGNIQDPRPEMQTAQQQSIAQEMVILKQSILGNSLTDLPKCSLHLLYGLFPKDQMNYLFKEADLFALLSKAEGFGLPIAEAIASETPVLVHDKGGHVGFTDPENNFLVDCHLTPANCTVFPFVYSCDSNWFDTDYLSARKQFRAAYNAWKEDKAAYTARATASKAYMLNVTGDSLVLGKKLVDFVVGENAQED